MDEMPGMIRPDLQALFPAHAGVIPSCPVTGGLSMSFPRLRGDDPTERRVQQLIANLSPPTRG